MPRLKSLVLIGLSVLAVPLSTFADEAEAIKKFVFTAQRAGFQRGNLDAYMKQWADDARIVMGRAEKPAKYDLAIKRKAIEATRRIRFTGLPEGGFDMKYSDASVKINGERAVLRVVMTAGFEGGHEKHQEVYRLRRVGDGWKVYENRAWPLETKLGDELWRYDKKTWEKLDAKVSDAKDDNDLRALANALQAAWRTAEAHQAARKLTKGPNASAEDWLTRGWLALNVGDAADATKAFKTALKLDPKAAVPKIIKK